MRKAIVLSLLFVLFWSALSSGQLPITKPNWENGERFTYEVRVRDTLVGSMAYQITDTVFDQIKAFKLKVTTNVRMGGESTADTVSLLVNKQNLKPLYSIRSVVTSGMVLRFTAKYLKDKVRISLESKEGVKQSEIDFPADGYDGDEITSVLRALNLRTGARYKFTNIKPVSKASFKTEVRVLSLEKVKTPLGEFLCSKVRMNVGGKEAEIWYQKDKPNAMVKYVITDGGTVVLLKSMK